MENIKNDLYELEVGSDGIAIMTINQVNNPTNLFSTAFIDEYLSVANQVIEDDGVKGMIVTSGRSMFMPGADLRELQNMGQDLEVQLKGMLEMHQKMRAIETGGKPFVAAINGTCMGGGLELCLLCHHRIVLDNPKIKLGFPESKVGLLPGGGGTVKAPYLMGIQNALTYLLQGKEARPQQALKDGLINELADSPEDLMAKAKAWIIANPKPVQPWDNKKHKIPGGGFWSPNGVQTMMGAAGNVAKMAHGNYPAQNAILKVVHDGMQIPIDRALEVEARYFTKLTASKEAKNMIRTGFLGMQAAKKGKARPKDEPKYEIKKLGILGAGMMGAGIAYVSAKAGMEVVLKDVSLEGAERGKAYSAKILDKAISRGRSTEEKKQALLDRITPTDDPNAMKDCDLVIEAVFEDPKLKDKVTKETEAVLDPNKIYASNTSTIPISLLAKSSERPENFIGMHFFSPVDKMPLVEIILGKKTEDKAIAAAVDYTVAIGKIPVVVNDGRGFYTSRTVTKYGIEGLALLSEGVPAVMIENIAKKIGFPVGPLALTDETSLTLSIHIYESDPNPNKTEFEKFVYSVTKDLVDNHKRVGRKTGAGFYDYPKEKGVKKKLWKELNGIYNSNPDTLTEERIKQRFFNVQALEAYRCLDTGILTSVMDGDIGSITGWGFPIYTGGVLSYIDYVGIQEFVDQCDAIKADAKFKERWEVPDSLRAMAAAGQSIHDFGKQTMSASEVKKMKEVDLVALANKMGITASVDDLKADTLKKVLEKLEA